MECLFFITNLYDIFMRTVHNYAAHLQYVCEGTTAGQPLAIYRRLGRTGDEWRVGHVVLKKTLISSRMDGLILLYLLS